MLLLFFYSNFAPHYPALEQENGQEQVLLLLIYTNFAPAYSPALEQGGEAAGDLEASTCSPEPDTGRTSTILLFNTGADPPFIPAPLTFPSFSLG